MSRGYKVVYDDGERLCSLARYMTVDGVEYTEGKTTYPRDGCGPLCVLETEEDARELVDSTVAYTVHLYECEYEPSQHDKVWSATRWTYDVESRSLECLRTSYAGTVLAESVTLGRRIASSRAR